MNWEKIVKILVVAIIALTVLKWVVSKTGNTSIPEEPCTPDYIGSCN